MPGRRLVRSLGPVLAFAVLVSAVGCEGGGRAPGDAAGLSFPKEVIFAERLGTDAAHGPTRAVVAGSLIFSSGILPVGGIPDTGPGEQLRQAFLALADVLREAGTTLDGLVRVTVYLADLENIAELDRVWAELFPRAAPARTVVQVAGLPERARVCLEAVAVRPLGKGLTPGEVSR